MEIELKLLVSPQGATALRRHRLLKEHAVEAPHDLDLSAIYFDTPDFRIRQSGAGLRVRRSGDAWVQTFKAGGSVSGGLHSRHEWESPVDGPHPDLLALRGLVERGSVWHKLLRTPALAQEIAPIFTARVARTVWNLSLPQGDMVECVLDIGELEHAGVTAPISEIELELKSGSVAHLFDFALALLQDIPMRTGALSKADRGYALCTPQAPLAVKAVSLVLLPDMTVEEAFQSIVANCMTQIQANESGVAQGHDVESLHQMRVGLRRLRSALDLFADVIKPAAAMHEELEWLNAQLSAPRDWDVLCSATLPAIANAAPQEQRIAAVTLGALGKSHETHEAAAEAVGSPRYTRLILAFTRWLQASSWRDDMLARSRKRLAGPLPGFAKAVLARRQQRLHKRARGLVDANASRRHRIRIAAKKSRYATEFFAALYPAKKVRRYVRALSALQDVLGHSNDGAVAGRLLQQLQDEQAAFSDAAGFIRGYLAAQGERDAKQIVRLWEKLEKVKAPV
ncbi:MAG: CYTH and CHAD domain-containing protein [Herminiimonas sp.]|nr:CYTH and CHAD domain-containing protein [Herminiimonas sp.]